MIHARRPRASAAIFRLTVALSGVALSACGSVTSSSTAFSVDGTTYSRDDLNDLMKALTDAGQFTTQNGKATKADISSVVSVMVQYTASRNLLETQGVKISDADRAAAREQLDRQGQTTLDEKTKDLIVDITVTGQAIDSLEAPSDAEALYTPNPSRTGVICARNITVKSEKAANEIIEKLAGGAKFADLAKSASTDEAGRANGGLVTNGTDSECIAIPALGQSIGEPVIAELIRTPVDRPTVAVKDTDGWHVAMHRPWTEVKTQFAKTFAENTGRLLLVGHLVNADVRLNSLYGTWNRVSAKVE